MRTSGIASALKFALAVALCASIPDQTLLVLTCVESVPTAVLFTVTVIGPAASAPEAVSRTPDTGAASTKTDTVLTTVMACLSLGMNGLTPFLQGIGRAYPRALVSISEGRASRGSPRWGYARPIPWRKGVRPF